MKGIILLNLAILMIIAAFASAATRLVPEQYGTIQAAIDASENGDVVLVASGNYTGEGNRDIDFKGKSITVKSAYGPESCIIQCGGRYGSGDRSNPIKPEYHRGFYFHSHEDANSVVQGFTVTQGYLDIDREDGGAIFCVDSGPTIKNCIIVGNCARNGGGIAAKSIGGITANVLNVQIENCVITRNIASDIPLDLVHHRTSHHIGGGICVLGLNAQLHNCLVAGNAASDFGGGLYCSEGDNHIINCTITGNITGKGGTGGGILFGSRGGDMSYLHNSIVWGNHADRDGNDIGLKGTPIIGGMRAHISNSLIGEDPNSVYDPSALISGEWLRTDPMFARNGYWDPNGTSEDVSVSDDFWIDGDYHLKSQAGRWDPNYQSWIQDDVTSPCIDAGDPNSPIGNEPFPNGGIINMGAYGGTVEASKSYFGRPVCETIIAGDINGDCKVDFDDLMILMAHWLEDYTPQD